MCTAVHNIKLTPLYTAAGINGLVLFKQVPAFSELGCCLLLYFCRGLLSGCDWSVPSRNSFAFLWQSQTAPVLEALQKVVKGKRE